VCAYIITTHGVWIRIVVPHHGVGVGVVVVVVVVVAVPSLSLSLLARRGMDRWMGIFSCLLRKLAIKLTGAGAQRTFTGIAGETVIGDLSF